MSHLWAPCLIYDRICKSRNGEFYSASNSEKQKTDIAKLPKGEETKITFEKYDNQGLISEGAVVRGASGRTWLFLQALSMRGQGPRSRKRRLCEVLALFYKARRKGRRPPGVAEPSNPHGSSV